MTKTDSKKLTMKFKCMDNFSNPVYKCIETGILYKDLNMGENENPDLYSCGNEIDGDPCYPINKELTIIFIDKYTEDPRKFDYMMLSRYKRDCEYYLGNGNRYAGHLYFKNEQEHIDEMKKLYNSFSDDKKPEWLTWEQIETYEKEMTN